MKKVIASILSLALLSGLFVNASFAEEIQPAEVTQEKAFNVQLNQSDLTAQEKAAEKLKSDLKKYNEKQQKLIQKYENMTDKEFKWDKIKKTFMKILGAVVSFLGTVWVIDLYYDKENQGYKKGVKAGYHNGHIDGYKEGAEKERSICEKGGGDYLMGFMMGLNQGFEEGRLKGIEEGFYQGEVKARTECDRNARAKCDNVLPDTGALVKKVLANLHPDHFPKNFDDVKDLYNNATNFYNTYLK